MKPSGKVEGADVPHDYVPGQGYVPRKDVENVVEQQVSVTEQQEQKESEE